MLALLPVAADVTGGLRTSSETSASEQPASAVVDPEVWHGSIPEESLPVPPIPPLPSTLQRSAVEEGFNDFTASHPDLAWERGHFYTQSYNWVHDMGRDPSHDYATVGNQHREVHRHYYENRGQRVHRDAQHTHDHYYGPATYRVTTVDYRARRAPVSLLSHPYQS